MALNKGYDPAGFAAPTVALDTKVTATVATRRTSTVIVSALKFLGNAVARPYWSRPVERGQSDV